VSAPSHLVTDACPSRDAPLADVAYVGGAGRSGSTVLALLLAQLPGVVAIGGLTNLWERGVKQNYLCGCGAPFGSCAFWQSVGDEAFGGWDQVRVDEVLRLQSAVGRYRHWPAHLAAPRLRHGFDADADEYSAYSERVYRAIAHVSRATTIVDNSHDISPALLLARTRGVRGHVIHLVRDPRGVAFSLARHVARAEADAGTYMPRYGVVAAATGWVTANLPYHVVPSRTLPRLRVRYESLVASPRAEIRRIAGFLAVDVSEDVLAMYDADAIPIAENHMISGNPHRLGRDRIELRLDEEWRTAMGARDRVVSTLLTLPLNAVYGYVGRRAAPRVDARSRNGGGPAAS
jgi:Sulfotransferase family